MSNFKGYIAIPLALALGVMLVERNSERAEAGWFSDTVSCEIRVNRHHGGVTLEGVALAKENVSGSYHMAISGGSSNVDQSGDFSASPGSPGSLGEVTLGGDGGSYYATLRVNWNGGSSSCTKRVSL